MVSSAKRHVQPVLAGKSNTIVEEGLREHWWSKRKSVGGTRRFGDQSLQPIKARDTDLWQIFGFIPSFHSCVKFCPYISINRSLEHFL